MTGDLQWLQEWYAGSCNGDWEHQFGVSIETLDNPGWTLSIDLAGSPLAGRINPRISVERTATDWYEWEVSKDKFLSHGGPENLTDLIRQFRIWAQSITDIGG